MSYSLHGARDVTLRVKAICSGQPTTDWYKRSINRMVNDSADVVLTFEQVPSIPVDELEVTIELPPGVHFDLDLYEFTVLRATGLPSGILHDICATTSRNRDGVFAQWLTISTTGGKISVKVGSLNIANATCTGLTRCPRQGCTTRHGVELTTTRGEIHVSVRSFPPPRALVNHSTGPVRDSRNIKSQGGFIDLSDLNVEYLNVEAKTARICVSKGDISLTDANVTMLDMLSGFRKIQEGSRLHGIITKNLKADYTYLEADSVFALVTGSQQDPDVAVNSVKGTYIIRREKPFLDEQAQKQEIDAGLMEEGSIPSGRLPPASVWREM
ncbi:hypothetical protein B0H17DRAFT_1261057 [Mycena rosella]|uniref:Adhesin domain-containing protein n=1 Tax=Mycena rosella TaxID=1033263 RepID=A0AAD7DUB9_MYCRO|nr:hypothetical protein B0H17DRAFT_1261057 [Mycena rosella]